MRSESTPAGHAAVRRWAHPFTPVLLISGLTAGVALLLLGGQRPEALAWVAIALSAGYAVSGSV